MELVCASSNKRCWIIWQLFQHSLRDSVRTIFYSRTFPTPTIPPHIMHPLLLLECKSDTLSRIRCPPTTMKLSTSHSYQTLRSSVWRQKLTSTSEFAGSCIGVCYTLAHVSK